MGRRWFHVILGSVLLFSSSWVWAQPMPADETFNDQIRTILARSILAEDLPASADDFPARQAFLTGCVDSLAALHAPIWDAPSLPQLERQGRQLLATGTNDPVVVMLYGLVRAGMDHHTEAAPWLRRGLAMSEDYPDSAMLLRAISQATLARCTDDLSQAEPSWHASAILTAWVANDIERYDRSLQGGLFDVINAYILNEMPLNPRLRMVYLSAALPDTTEWLCKMLAAQAHLHAVTHPAESASSAEFATDFQPDIDHARLLLEAAFALRPDLPQTPAEILKGLYVDGSGAEPTEAFLWFNVALEIDPDYVPAYFAYAQALRQSAYWGREAYFEQFGESCLASQQFMTPIPAIYLFAMGLADDVAPEGAPDLRARLRSQSGHLEDMLEGYRQADLPPGELRDISATICFIAAVTTGDWVVAREYLDQIGDLRGRMDMLESWREAMGMAPIYAIGQTLAETGPRAEGLARSRELYRQGHYAETLSLLTDLVRQDDITGPEIAYLHSAIQYVLTTQELEAGRWINMMPDTLLTGWTVRAGQAWVDSHGNLICRPNADNTFRMTFNRPVGAHFEYRGTARRTGDTEEWQAGLSLGDDGHSSYYQVLLSPDRDGILLLDRHYSEGSWSRPINQEHTLDLLCWDRRVTLYLDDALLTDPMFLDDLHSEANSRIGVSADYSEAPAIYHGLQFRLIDNAQQALPTERQLNIGIPAHRYRPAYMADADLPTLSPVPQPRQATFTDARGAVSVSRVMGRLHQGWDCRDLFLQSPDRYILTMPPTPGPSVLYDGDLSSGGVFVDELAQPGYLVGVRLRSAMGGGIQSIQPIYESDLGQSFGGRNGLGTNRAQDLIALEGYAVAGVALHRQQHILGLQLIFMRITPQGRLDPSDQYRSRWFGLATDEPRELIASDTTVIGIVGEMSDASVLTDLGLVIADEADMRGVATYDHAAPVAELALPALPPQPAILAAGDHHYAVLGMMTLEEAREACRQLGGHLPRLADEDDVAMLRHLMAAEPGGKAAWLDGVIGQEGQVVWADGEQRDLMLTASTYTDIVIGRPALLAPAGRPHPVGAGNADDRRLAVCQWETGPRPAGEGSSTDLPNPTEFAGRWYAMIDLPVTFDEAQHHAQLMGGQLAHPMSEEANTFLTTLSGGRPAWIALASDDQRHWRWTHDAPLEFSRLVRPIWETGSMAALFRGSEGLWIPADRSQRQAFLCQWDTPPTQEDWDAYLTHRFIASTQADSPTESTPVEPVPQTPAIDPIEFEGHWYQCFGEPVTWPQAQAACQEMGGHLIIINSEEENTFASFFVTGTRALWIGLTDEAQEGTWRWVDGTPAEFTAWAPGEPNDWQGREDHAEIALYEDDGVIYARWNDSDIAHVDGFICEWDHNPLTGAEE